MTPDEGMSRLVFHAQTDAGSFLDMLRPYRGLREEILNDVLVALRASAPKISDRNPPRDMVSALWAISYLGRLWALEPGGMLRRNQLISDADQGKLAAFLERFDYAVMTLLEGGPPEDAFADGGQRLT
jgi:hypothetical protein